MNLCERIRALISNARKKKKVGAVVAALPQYPPNRVRESIAMMFHADPPILRRSGNRSEGFAYWVARDVAIKAYPSEEVRREKTLERERLRNRRRRGGGSLEELRAKQAEAREARKALPRSARPKRVPSKEPENEQAYRAKQAQSRADRAAAKAMRAEERRQQRETEKVATQEAIDAKRALWRERKAQHRAKVAAAPPREKSSLPKRTLTGTPAPRARSGTIGKIAPVKERMETVEEWMARTGARPEVLPAGVFRSPPPTFVWEASDAP